MHTQKTTAKNEVIIEGPLLFQFHWLHGKKFFLEIFCFSFHEHLMLMSSFTSRSTSIEYDLNTNRLRTAIALVFFHSFVLFKDFNLMYSISLERLSLIYIGLINVGTDFNLFVFSSFLRLQ